MDNRDETTRSYEDVAEIMGEKVYLSHILDIIQQFGDSSQSNFI